MTTSCYAGSLSLRRRPGRHRLPALHRQFEVHQDAANDRRILTMGGATRFTEGVRVVPCRAPNAAAIASWSVQPSQKAQALRGWNGSRGVLRSIQDPVG